MEAQAPTGGATPSTGGTAATAIITTTHTTSTGSTSTPSATTAQAAAGLGVDGGDHEATLTKQYYYKMTMDSERGDEIEQTLRTSMVMSLTTPSLR